MIIQYVRVYNVNIPHCDISHIIYSTHMNIYTHTRMALLEIGFFLWGGVVFFADFLRFFGEFSHPSDTGRSPVIRELRFTSVGDFVTPSLVSFGTLQEGLHYAFNFENLTKHFGGTK